MLYTVRKLLNRGTCPSSRFPTNRSRRGAINEQFVTIACSKISKSSREFATWSENWARNVDFSLDLHLSDVCPLQSSFPLGRGLKFSREPSTCLAEMGGAHCNPGPRPEEGTSDFHSGPRRFTIGGVYLDSATFSKFLPQLIIDQPGGVGIEIGGPQVDWCFGCRNTLNFPALIDMRQPPIRGWGLP